MMYSSIINFFGPLQSGPGFRAAYLKKRHKINLKKYTLATLLYYGFYALFSGILLLAALIGIWSLALCVAGLLLVPVILRAIGYGALAYRHIHTLALASLAQVLVLSLIYYVELRSLGSGAEYSQVLSYTGAANFALFVSLTPGAIGFRESFLLFSQQLHGISNELIITASLLDRSIYILFLLAMAVIVFGLHAGDFIRSNDRGRE